MRLTIRHNQSGFSVFEGVLVVLFLAVVGFAGYTVYNNQNSDDDVVEPVVVQQETIENEQDLQSAEEELNELSIDELDTSELDAIEDELL